MSDIKHAPPEQVQPVVGPELGTNHDLDPQMTRRVLFKLDIRIIPILALLFLCSFLDRTNVGNARIIGLEKDLKITNLQYERGLTVFYAFYIACEIPSNLLLRRVSPKIWLPFLTCVWGILAMCVGFVKGFGSFVALRALLGLAEGGSFPGMILYLSGMYRRGELALRIGLVYTAASLSGAFGGLLARGLSAIGHRGGLTGWRWILIIEGLFTVACSILAYTVLPNSIETAAFLTPSERAHAVQRLQINAANSTDDIYSLVQLKEASEKFKWSEVRRGIFNLQVWLSAFAYFAILTGLYSFSLFLPTIINDTGFSSSANQTQLWTVIPYAVAAVLTVCVAFLSDRLKLRGVLVLFTLPFAIIGYAAIANVKRAQVKYGMTFLMATGLYSSVPCILSWNANNSAGHYKRATTSALQLGIANCGGLLANWIYPSKQKPRYHEGHTTVLGLLVFAWVMILCNTINIYKKNRDKKMGKYDKFAGIADDRDPQFHMIM